MPTDSIGIPPNFLKVAWEGKRKKLIMFSRKDRLEIGFFDHSREKITSISHTCRLSRDCLEDYYLHIPVPTPKHPSISKTRTFVHWGCERFTLSTILAKEW